MKRKDIRIGPAGWSYKDWAGKVYPKRKPKGFNQLKYISKFFNTVEVNTSFYRIPSPEATLKWIESVFGVEDLDFVVKLWQGFTHLRKYKTKDIDDFREMLKPLSVYERLGCLLIQFPHSFHMNEENGGELRKLVSEFEEYPLTVEFRHSSWDHPDVTDYFKEKGIAFCNIDQPKIGKTIPLTSYVTAPFSYFRFHGRREDKWFEENKESYERYDYLYSDEEMDNISEKIRPALRNSEKLYAITNNHYSGKAVINALQLKQKLTGKKVKVPEALFEIHPELETIAENHFAQLRLL